MATVALSPSVLGLRSAGLGAAGPLRGAGHEVLASDLFDGATAATLDEGPGLADRIGWGGRARPAGAAGHVGRDRARRASMGVGVVGDLRPERPATAGVLLLHATTTVLPASVRPGPGVQSHAAPDDFAPPARVAAPDGTGVRCRP